MGMISNYTRRSTGVLEQHFEDYSGKTAHLILFIWGDQKSFSAYNGYGGVLGTTMSCQPGVVSDPERTLNQDFASISVPSLALSELKTKRPRNSGAFRRSDGAVRR